MMDSGGAWRRTAQTERELNVYEGNRSRMTGKTREMKARREVEGFGWKTQGREDGKRREGSRIVKYAEKRRTCNRRSIERWSLHPTFLMQALVLNNKIKLPLAGKRAHAEG